MELFADCDVVCEAFDNPVCKAELVSTLLSESETIRIVSGSGMAGYGSSNTIVTRKRMSRLYVCGDGETAAANGIGLMSPRVTVCAGHEANMVHLPLADTNLLPALFSVPANTLWISSRQL